MEGKFTGFNRVDLYYRSYQTNLEEKGVILLVHGHGDHSGGLRNLYNTFLNQGYSVFALDLRGHGKSPGKRGFVNSWEEYRQDLHAFRLFISERSSKDVPLFLLGHSLGGVVCLDYILKNSNGIEGLMLIAPAISYELSFVDKVLIHLMSKIKPDYALNKPGKPHLLTSDQDVIESLLADDLRHNTVTPGLGISLMQTLTIIINNASSIHIPLLLQYGLEDKVTPPQKLGQFFEEVGSEDKLKIEYKELLHRPFDDLGKEQFLTDLINWLVEHTKVSNKVLN